MRKSCVALSAVVAAISAEEVEAAIVYSGIVNINVPATIDGIYLNVVTGAASSNPQLAQGWDINPYQSGSISPAFSFFTTSTATNGDAPPSSRGYMAASAIGPALSLSPAQPIGAFATFNTSTTSGANFTIPGSHYLGFRFQNEANGNQVHYGWARITRPGDGGIATIVDYAYESNAGASIPTPFPEPSSLALLALGAQGLFKRRREAVGC